MPDYPVILIADHICCALKFGHNGELLNDVLHHAVKIFLSLSLRHSFIQYALKLRITLGHCDDFQCRFVDLTEVLTLDLINRAEAALAQLALNGKLFKYRGAIAICMLHTCPSCVCLVDFLLCHRPFPDKVGWKSVSYARASSIVNSKE